MKAQSVVNFHLLTAAWDAQGCVEHFTALGAILSLKVYMYIYMYIFVEMTVLPVAKLVDW